MCKAEQVAQVHAEPIRRAIDADLRIAMGTGSGVGAHGGNLEELALMQACGLTPAQVLAATTSSSAELLGCGDELGRLAPPTGRTWCWSPVTSTISTGCRARSARCRGTGCALFRPQWTEQQGTPGRRRAGGGRRGPGADAPAPEGECAPEPRPTRNWGGRRRSPDPRVQRFSRRGRATLGRWASTRRACCAGSCIGTTIRTWSRTASARSDCVTSSTAAPLNSANRSCASCSVRSARARGSCRASNATTAI